MKKRCLFLKLLLIVIASIFLCQCAVFDSILKQVGVYEDGNDNPNDDTSNDTNNTGSSSGGTDTNYESNSPSGCGQLPKPTGMIITVSTTSELHAALNKATGKTTIYLKNGIYRVSNSSFFYVKKNNITIRSLSGKRSDVIIKGQGMGASKGHHGFLVSGKNVTIADLTIQDVPNHGVQIQGEHDTDNCRIHNIHFINIKEQMIKISKRNDKNVFADNGIVECCKFEFTSSHAPHYYTGGIDGHRCNNWIIRNNVFKNIKSPSNNLAEHAIHFWGGSKNITVENNVIINCDRGIGFGMGKGNYAGGGIIRNNMIHTTRDVGIILNDAKNIRIYNNTLHTKNYGNSIEIRWSGATGNKVINNLMSGVIRKRDGGQAEVKTNVTYSQSEMNMIFKNANKNDYRLKSSANKAINKGMTLSDVKTDIDGNNRPKGSGYDIGADEF